MATSVNKVVIVGNLGKDPEVRYTSGGQVVANFSLATSDTWTDRQTGVTKEKVAWHRIVVWGEVAERCGQYLRKGRQVYVEGRLQSREWTSREGRKLTSTEIVAAQVVFVGDREDRPAQDSGQAAGSPAPRDEEVASEDGHARALGAERVPV